MWSIEHPSLKESLSSRCLELSPVWTPLSWTEQRGTTRPGCLPSTSWTTSTPTTSGPSRSSSRRSSTSSTSSWICILLTFSWVITRLVKIRVYGNVLDGEFRKYGLEVVSMMEDNPEDRCDPMARIFPKVTKCTFNKFGPTGTLMRRDALCVLPVNIINEVSLTSD